MSSWFTWSRWNMANDPWFEWSRWNMANDPWYEWSRWHMSGAGTQKPSGGSGNTQWPVDAQTRTRTTIRPDTYKPSDGSGKDTYSGLNTGTKVGLGVSGVVVFGIIIGILVYRRHSNRLTVRRKAQGGAIQYTTTGTTSLPTSSIAFQTGPNGVYPSRYPPNTTVHQPVIVHPGAVPFKQPQAPPPYGASFDGTQPGMNYPPPPPPMGLTTGNVPSSHSAANPSAPQMEYDATIPNEPPPPYPGLGMPEKGDHIYQTE